jgi:Transglutaminase-like superfamily
MKNSLVLLALSFSLMFVFQSCNKEKHFITDEEYREQVQTDFEAVKELASNRSDVLFDVFEQDLSLEEEEALKFLYAYMPLSDLADYNGKFFLENVRLAFAARDTFSWGEDIPEDVFRHFVLPHRVNNENLDSSRSVLFNELIDRIIDLPMKEAALEVNHWCHEKVNYRATDSRTISPIGVMKTAYGRCGEESTFTVAALRSVGIPARQVYTPRWAHCDDNHAWVEVWIDGSWQFMGACEPLADLNMGWFEAPVVRAMMVHTKAYGKYFGSEKVIEIHEKYSILNLLSNYTETKQINILVVDDNGKEIEGVHVEFSLYNYAEFYSLKTVNTDSLGKADLETGFGDILVFASHPEYGFSYTKIAGEETAMQTITLTNQLGYAFEMEMDNIPPAPKEAAKHSEGGEKHNQCRLAQEDSIREAYIESFVSKEEAYAFAEGYELDTARTWNLLRESRGNSREIKKYLTNAVSINKTYCLDLLEILAKKDLHDVSAEILIDHLRNFSLETDELSDIEMQYILNPRISLEMIRPYRSFLQEKMAEIQKSDVKKTVNALTAWIKSEITIDTLANYYGAHISPIGTYELRHSDLPGRDLFFVAVCRSFHIPARLDLATRTPQFYNEGEWHDALFSSEENMNVEKEISWLKLLRDNSFSKEALYRIHFSLAVFEDTHFVTLEYDWDQALTDFPEKLSLEPGYYKLLTGNRMADGSVLVYQKFFVLEKDMTTEVQIKIRKSFSGNTKIAVWKEMPVDVDNYAIIAWIDPSTEPGKHFLKEMTASKSEYEKQNISISVFAIDEKNINKMKPIMPKQTKYLVDDSWKILDKFQKQTALIGKDDLPIFIIADKDANLWFHTSGYGIGTTEILLNLIQNLKESN